jgi:molecular chaperone DnaK
MNQIKMFRKMPFAFGIETFGGNFFKILDKNTKLPAKFSTKLRTVIDNQPRIHLKFYLGDRPIANLNKYLCDLKLKIAKPDGRGQEIDLEVRISRSGDASIFLNHKITYKSVCKK